jgi:hypothetical protein
LSKIDENNVARTGKSGIREGLNRVEKNICRELGLPAKAIAFSRSDRPPYRFRWTANDGSTHFYQASRINGKLILDEHASEVCPSHASRDEYGLTEREMIAPPPKEKEEDQSTKIACEKLVRFLEFVRTGNCLMAIDCILFLSGSACVSYRTLSDIARAHNVTSAAVHWRIKDLRQRLQLIGHGTERQRRVKVG